MNLYRGRPETWNFDRAKTTRIDDRKLVHIPNIDQFTIVDSSEFSRGSKSKFQAGRGIKLSLFILCGCLRLYASEGATLDLLISAEKIEHRIQEIAQDIEKEYHGKELVLLSVLKGAMCLTSDLMRHLPIPCTVEYIKASSYGKNGTKRGTLTISGIEGLDLTSKHVLVVDDILDSGYTMKGIVEHLQQKHPKSVKTLVLLSKNIPRDSNYRPDYTLFDIPDRFVVGYGLDYKEYYRNLPAIYAFPGDTPIEITRQ